MGQNPERTKYVWNVVKDKDDTVNQWEEKMA